ncbi:MAG TPA: hypothetical protein VGF86_13090 [Candidatus Tumulicola sp.]
MNLEGFCILSDVVDLLQTVDAWNAAYPFEALANRIAVAYMETETAEDAVDKLLSELAGNCKMLRAYRPIFGFNMVDGATIAFGDAVLGTLGNERLEKEILSPFSQSVARFAEPLRSGEIERKTKSLKKAQERACSNRLLREFRWSNGVRASTFRASGGLHAVRHWRAFRPEHSNHRRQGAILERIPGRNAGRYSRLRADAIFQRRPYSAPHRHQAARHRKIHALGIMALAPTFIKPT